MAIDFARMLAGADEKACAWWPREAALYALAVGAARDPMNERELPFVLEDRLTVLPTFVSIIGFAAGAKLLSGIDAVRMLDAGRRIIFHRSVAREGRCVATTRVTHAIDKGVDRGAIIVRASELHDDAGAIATIVTDTFARGDGGFGEAFGPALPPPIEPPRRGADLGVAYGTWPSQALLYRLCGDRNPLHADPAFARKAGFTKPILHGMCTFGMAGWAVLQHFADYDPAALRAIEARFSGVVFPGETLAFSFWRDGREVFFEARVLERNALVLKGGRAELA